MGKLKPYKVEFSTEFVTPDIALAWIAKSWGQNGRNFVPTRIEKIMEYASAMTGGNWRHTPTQDSIKLKDGIVTDGRHRLFAILLSHTTQLCDVKRKFSVN